MLSQNWSEICVQIGKCITCIQEGAVWFAHSITGHALQQRNFFLERGEIPGAQQVPIYSRYNRSIWGLCIIIAPPRCNSRLRAPGRLLTIFAWTILKFRQFWRTNSKYVQYLKAIFGQKYISTSEIPLLSCARCSLLKEQIVATSFMMYAYKTSRGRWRRLSGALTPWRCCYNT